MLRSKWLPWLLAATAAAAALVYGVPAVRIAVIDAARSVNATMRSLPGFVESLSLVFLSELGDKTFFIAALLAMRLGKMVSFVGSVTSLGCARLATYTLRL